MRRRPAPLPDLRLAAGQLGDQPAEPVAPRGDHRHRLGAAGRRRERLHRGQAGRPQHRGRRLDRHRARHGPAHPLRSPHAARSASSASGPSSTAWASRPPSIATASSGRSRSSTRAGTRASCGSPATAIFRSADEGQSWEIVSPDLTRNDPSKLGPSGGPITRDNTGAEVYCTIFALAESPHERDVLWAGTDDGLVHLSRDRGKTWQAVTPPDLPRVGAGQHHRALAARRGHLLRRGHALQARRHAPVPVQDERLRAHVDAHHGRAARRRVHARRSARTRRAAACSTPAPRAACRSRSTTAAPGSACACNLPVAPIHDLIVKDTDLVVATHGRSFWILDDLTPLHQMADGDRPTPTRTCSRRARRCAGARTAATA